VGLTMMTLARCSAEFGWIKIPLNLHYAIN
jgi:hypothetical protein